MGSVGGSSEIESEGGERGSVGTGFFGRGRVEMEEEGGEEEEEGEVGREGVEELFRLGS